MIVICIIEIEYVIDSFPEVMRANIWMAFVNDSKGRET